MANRRTRLDSLLKIGIDAHGGLNAWNQFENLRASVSIGGALWEQKQLPGLFNNSRIDLKLRQQCSNRGLVANVAAHKSIARILIQAGEIFDIAGVGQGIEYDHAPFSSVRQPVPNEIRADKAGPTRNEHITRHEVHPASCANCAANVAQGL